MNSGGLLLNSLVLLLALGCAPAPVKSGAYKPTIPSLNAEPIAEACWIDIGEGQGYSARCVRLLEGDYQRIVTELKAACLALGWGDEYCQTQR